MKNKRGLFFLVLIISTLTVGQPNIALADKLDTNSEDIKRERMEAMRIMEVMRGAHPYHPFAATWPNSEGILLDIQMNTSTRSHAYSIDRVGDGYRYFRSFITATINHLSSTLKGLNVDEKDGAGEPEVKVIFVRKALVAQKNDRVVAVPPSLIPEADLSCRLVSPWVRLDIQRFPVLRIHAIFFWNERQFLIDQALLSGESITDLSAVPYEHTLYRQYTKDYALSEGGVTLESRDPGISERIPGELLWMFRRGTFFDGNVGYPRNWSKVQEQRVKSYSALIQSLFDQCYSSEHFVLQRYKTILDIRDRNIFPLDKYQVNLPVIDLFK